MLRPPIRTVPAEGNPVVLATLMVPVGSGALLEPEATVVAVVSTAAENGRSGSPLMAFAALVARAVTRSPTLTWNCRVPLHEAMLQTVWVVLVFVNWKASVLAVAPPPSAMATA